MELGLFTCGYQYESIEAAFADAAAFGYDFIELWGGRPHAWAPDMTAERAAHLRELSERYNVPIRIYTPEHNGYPYNYMLGDEAQWEDCMRYLTRSMEAAAQIGASHTLISVGHGGHTEPQYRHDRLMRSLRRLAEEARSTGQTILLEPLSPFESNTCTTAAEIAAVLSELNDPTVCTMCDMVASYVQDETAAEFYQCTGSAMVHLHIADSDGRSEAHILPGDGTLPLRSELEALRQVGYDGTATIELVSMYTDNPTYYARCAIERTRELL